MDQLPLATTGRSTSRLGFGCSTLMGRMNRRESLAVLDAAWDAGIRHFDVAPLYGWGAAESCVGEFLRRHYNQATVTTKYGVLPPPRQSWTGLARKLARPVIRAIPGLKQRVARVATAALGTSRKATISAQELRASLEHSRVALQMDRIDLLLLHDVDADHLADPVLLDAMRESVAAGLIGDFGVSHDLAEIPKLYAERREYCHVMQFEWSARQAIPQYSGSFRIHHRSLANNFAVLRDLLAQRTDLRVAWSDQLGCDLGSPQVLSALMLKAALTLNPDSVILVSSKNPLHISANARVGEDPKLEAPARQFYELVQHDLISLDQEITPPMN